MTLLLETTFTTACIALCTSLSECSVRRHQAAAPAAPAAAPAAPAEPDAAPDAGGGEGEPTRVYRDGDFRCDGRYCWKFKLRNSPDEWLDTTVPGGCGNAIQPLPHAHSVGVWTVGQGKGFGEANAPENPLDPAATNRMRRWVLYYNAATTRCTGADGAGTRVMMPACYHREIRRRHPEANGEYDEAIEEHVHPDFNVPAAQQA